MTYIIIKSPSVVKHSTATQLSVTGLPVLPYLTHKMHGRIQLPIFHAREPAKRTIELIRVDPGFLKSTANGYKISQNRCCLLKYLKRTQMTFPGG